MRSNVEAAGQVVVDLDRIVHDGERLADLVEDLVNEAGRAARGQAVEKRGSDVESITLALKARGASARRRVLLEHDYVEPSTGEQRCRDESANAGADDDRIVFTRFHALSNLPRAARDRSPSHPITSRS